jgi:iron-sulfur cluster assembly protein
MSTVSIENAAGTPAQAPKGIEVTEKALAHIRSVMAKENISSAEGGLRLGVQGGGCSGLSYVIRFETGPSAIASSNTGTSASLSIPNRSST